MRETKQEQQLRAGARKRAAEVQRTRYEKLENELVERTVADLETDLRSPQLAGPLTSVVATAATLGVPLLSVILAIMLGPDRSPWLLAILCSAALLLASVIGSTVWCRSPRSQGLPYGQLMLWNWVRQRRAEAQLVSSARSLGLDRWGSFVSSGEERPEERMALLYRLNAALEMKDPYTLGHSRRVARHCYRMALALRLPGPEMDTLQRAASLHDIGKLAVPDHILRKPGKLSPKEWELMNAHSAAGAKILSILGIEAINEAVRSHHERWDGAGYPDGLKGEAIPLFARVIAVADTYDAITTSRPYRDRAGRRRAIRVLREERGRQFDPAVVDAMLLTLDRPAVLAFLSLLLHAPRAAGDQLVSWLRTAASRFPVPAAAVTAASLLVAITGPMVLPPPDRSAPKQRESISLPLPAVPFDSVLGTQIKRSAEKAPKKAAARDKERQRGRDGSHAARGTADPKAPDASVGGQSAENETRASESDTPTFDPNASGDPQGDLGRDCAHPGVDSRGSDLHCGG